MSHRYTKRMEAHSDKNIMNIYQKNPQLILITTPQRAPMMTLSQMTKPAAKAQIL